MAPAQGRGLGFGRPMREAAAYDQWFRGEVAQALKDAEDPNTKWRTTEEVMASVDAKVASLKKKKRKAG